MTGRLTFIDASMPLPTGSYLKADGIAFYIGGDTPHVWTKEEIDATPYRYRLPIFVRSDPQKANADTDVQAALATLGAIGAPKETLVALDFETAVDDQYVAEFCLGLIDYDVILYGSENFVHKNNLPDRLYWGADWTAVNHIHPGDAMTQWLSMKTYDESTAEASLPFWDTSKTTPPKPVPTPAPTVSPITVSLTELAKGATGQAVRDLQGLLVARGYGYLITPKTPGDYTVEERAGIDGDFGSQTDAAVRKLQTDYKLSSDGVVGPVTWEHLLS